MLVEGRPEIVISPVGRELAIHIDFKSGNWWMMGFTEDLMRCLMRWWVGQGAARLTNDVRCDESWC